MNPFYQAFMQMIDQSTAYSPPPWPALISPSPQAYGQRIGRPDRQPGQGGAYHMPWEVPATASTVQAGQTPVGQAQEDDPLAQLYKEIDKLWTQYHALGEQIASSSPEDVEEPELVDIPLSMPMLPMPEPVPLDRTAVTLASLATLFNPAGGAQYLGVPLQMQERATRTEQERWAILQQMVATQYRNVVAGIEAMNRLKVQMYQLKKTKAEDLYRQRMTALEQQRMRILDRISQMEQLAARLREERAYRQATAQARMTQAEAAMLRAQTGQEALEARKPVLEAQADYLQARAEATRALTPEQVRVLRAKAEQLSASTVKLLKDASTISNRVTTKQNMILRTGRTYMSAEDVDLRNMSKTFYQLLDLREKTVKEMLGEGYSLANPEDRAEIDSLVSTHDETLARLAYQMYVATGGALNKFMLLRDVAIATEWEQRAKSAVRRLETAKAAASVPTMTFQFRTATPSPAQGAQQQKKPAEKSTVQRWLEAVRNWLPFLRGKPAGAASGQQPPKAQQQSQQPPKAQQPAKGTATQKPQPIEIVVTDVVIEKVKQQSRMEAQKQAQSKKKTQPQKPKITLKSFGEVK
jgi:hypothetical protein